MRRPISRTPATPLPLLKNSGRAVSITPRQLPWPDCIAAHFAKTCSKRPRDFHTRTFAASTRRRGWCVEHAGSRGAYAGRGLWLGIPKIGRASCREREESQVECCRERSAREANKD